MNFTDRPIPEGASIPIRLICFTCPSPRPLNRVVRDLNYRRDLCDVILDCGHAMTITSHHIDSTEGN